MSSYKDFLAGDETVDRSVSDFCEILEQKGWVATARTQRGIRYWCGCTGPRQHQQWIDLKPLSEQRISFIWRNSCLTPEENQQ